MKKTRLKRASGKRIKENKKYITARDEYLADKEFCERCKTKFDGTTPKSLHHKKGRGKYLADKEHFSALCTDRYNGKKTIEGCHDWIHRNPNEARKEGWLLF